MKNPSFEIMLLLIISILSITLDSLVSLTILALVSFLWFLFSHPTRKQILFFSILVLSSVWGITFSQALFYPSTQKSVLFVILSEETPILGDFTGGLAIYSEGLIHGAFQSLRFIATISAGFAVSLCVGPTTLIRGLNYFRVPTHLAFTAATVFRFIPLTLEESTTALRAQRMRGLRIFGKCGLNLFTTLFKLSKPIIAASIRRSETITFSMLSRAYNPNIKQPKIELPKIEKKEKIFIISLCSITGFIIFAKILLMLHTNGLFSYSYFGIFYRITSKLL
ncbi:MAG: energy-coupling factor transporter transmembrane component T [Nitrospinota bacterium]|nr:energy-coupling factor transporter transmembrane component T [Nitrospinota bacterium]